MGQNLYKPFNRIPFHRAYMSLYRSIATLAFAILPLCLWTLGIHGRAIEAEMRKPTAHPAFPCANDSLNLTPIPPASIEARKHWKYRYKLGYWSYPKGMVQRAYFNAAAGSEYSTYIENPRRTPALIRRVCLVLRMWVDLIEETRPFPTVPLRLHIRAYNPQTQTPGNDLLARAVMLSRTDRKLKAWFDVRQDSIIMPPEGVCVGVEWLCSDTVQMEGSPVEPPVQVFTGGTDGQSWECSNGDTWQPLHLHNAANTPVNMRIGIEVLQ